MLAALERRFLVDLLTLLPDGKTSVVRKANGRALPPRRLKCPKCRRQFRLPMHLGRHIATTHPVKRKRAA